MINGPAFTRRTIRGQRAHYSKTEQERFSFTKHARELGLTIDAIRKFIDQSQHPDKNRQNCRSDVLS